ncbi:MAG: hypothetical protein A2231_08140 [Candidatus Firestonebacteria bacterium RIFOXYA2_FULL_40_8]|nr:MAG: hypothetical protein A2231_08140 [Candidatus Firestonebacteria bacterium RIFOXYA2_FULL_40_8]
MDSKDYKPALSTYEKIMAIESKPVEAIKTGKKESFASEGMRFLMQEVDALTQRKLVPEAVQLTQIIIDKLPANIEAKAKMAALLEIKGLNKEAAQSYRKVSGLYFEKGQRDDAEKYSALAAKLDPQKDDPKTAIPEKKTRKDVVSFL